MADMTTKILTVELRADAAVNGIINLNNAIDKNTQQMKANSAQIKQNNADIEKGTGDVMKLTAQNQVLAQSNVELTAKTKVLKDERRVLQKETQNEIKMQTEEEGSLKALRAELSRATNEFDKLGRAERETGAKGKELRDKINLLTTEIKDAEFATQRYYRNVGNYQQSILSAIGLNGRWGQSITNIINVQGGFSGAMASMGASVKAFGASLMALMTNPVFLAIAGIAGVGMAFKWFYDYNEGLAEASRLTEQFTGLQGEQMQGFRDKVMATADVMGKDFKETLQAADTVMANFHVDGEQAMDAINKGFAAGVDVNGDFLNKIQQFAPTFHDAGISAEQMVAIISQTKSGIFTDQGLEAIKQGSTRIREMSAATKQSLQSIGIDVTAMQAKLRDGTMTTFDALQQVSAQLKTMPDDSQEVGNVMADVFGRQGKFAAQEMIEGLADMSTSLDDVAAQTGDYGELLLENIDTEEELNNVTAALFDMTDNGWESIKQQATIYAKKALVAVVKGLVDVANWFIKLYNSSLPVRAAVNGIATGFKILWSVVKFAFNNIINGFKTIGRGISAVVNGFNQAGNAIKAFGQGVALIFKGIATMSWETIEKGWNTLSSGIKHAAISAFDGLKEVVTSGAADWADAAGNFGKEVGGYIIDGIKESISGQMNEITIPAFAGGGGGGSASTGGGGGGSSSSSSGGSGGSRKSNGGGSRKKGSSGGSRKTGGGSRKTGGGGSRKSGGTGKRQETDEEKAEKEYQKRIDDLIKKGADLEMKALEESAKKTEEKAEELAKKQKEALVKMYGGEDYLKARLAAATTDADKKRWESALKYYQQMEKQIEEDEKNNKKIIKENAEKEAKEREKRAAEIAKQLQQLWIEEEKDGSEDRLNLQLGLIEMERDAELASLKEKEAAELAALKNNEEEKQKVREQYYILEGAIQTKYDNQREKAEKEHHQKELQAVQTFAETMLASTEEHEQANLDWRLKSLQQQMELELMQYEDNEEMKAAIRAKYQQLELQARREHTQAVIAIEQEKYNAIGSIVGGLGEIMGAFGEQNKEMLVLQKTLALGEILIAQAVAIANAVKAGSNAVTPWQMIAQIASSVVAVTTAIAQAFNALHQAKFATGGYISGAGTSTSDSIPIRVSNGESIMNAETTAMFGGLLSSLNQLGGGVPIQVQETAASVRGEDMLARAFARGVAMLPNPVVSVEDINRGQRQVEVMNERATL